LERKLKAIRIHAGCVTWKTVYTGERGERIIAQGTVHRAQDRNEKIILFYIFQILLRFLPGYDRRNVQEPCNEDLK
jgi:hypothetical protein